VAWTRRNGANDPFVRSGRALQEVFIDLSALRSRINVSGLRSEHIAAPGHHGYQRASVPNIGPALERSFASPGCAGAGKTGPFRFVLSQTSAGKRDVIGAIVP
jgi:hypothetical protein